jgi:lipoprotein-anchoring transpeptidase ErfK/SrfK
MTTTKFSALALASLLLGVGTAHSQRVLGEPVAVDSAAAADSLPPVVARGPLRLEVSLADRRLYVYQGGLELRSYPVAVGKHQHPTPQGEFRIRRVIWNPRWVPPKVGWARGKKPMGPGEPGNPMGRVKMFFQEPDYYIHGTNNEESLGEAASHGCVRMANEDIVSLAQLVMEHGGQPREPNWFQKILNRVRRSQEVRLPEPVQVVIRG